MRLSIVPHGLLGSPLSIVPHGPPFGFVVILAGQGSSISRAHHRPVSSVFVVFLLSGFVFGVAPHGGPGSLGILLHGVRIPDRRFLEERRRVSVGRPTLHTLEVRGKLLMVQPRAFQIPEHGCSTTSAGTSG